jgi:hypothetical protein
MNLTKREWNRDYNLFQQDPLFDGLDAVHHDDFDFDNTAYEFLTKPVKIGETVRCKLTSLNKVFSEYLLVMETDKGYQIPLMVAKKSKLSTLFLIQTYENYSLQNNIGIATIEKGLFSSNYLVYEARDYENINLQGTTRKQILRIDYDKFLKNVGIPLKMLVYIPGIDERFNQYYVDSYDDVTNNDIYKSKEANDNITINQTKGYIEMENENMLTLGLAKYGNKTANVSVFNKRIVKLISNPPFYDKKANTYRLKMSERVKLSSVVNFQLINETTSNYIALQFGKLDQNTFTCDFSYPLNPLQAFSIVVTRMDKMNIFNQ